MPSPEKFKETLYQYNIEPSIIDEINLGYEEVVSKSPRKSKRDYFKHAMDVFDSQVPRDIEINLMDDNGCCKSQTAREKASIQFAKIHSNKTLEEKLPLISNVKNMGEAKLTEDGKLHILAVQYFKDDQFRCACPSINTGRKKEDAISRTYCMCCAGHFRYHYQIMLGCMLKLESVLTSPLDSNGEEPCSFIFKIEERHMI